MSSDSDLTDGDLEELLKGLNEQEDKQVDVSHHRQNLDEDYLAMLDKLCSKTTPGPWYPRAGDDDMCMNARWISTDPGVGYRHNGFIYEHPSDKCVAITLLQSPRLADVNDCYDRNMEFICEAKYAVPKLIAKVRELTELLAIERDKNAQGL
jgi:hypothetical protein